MANHNTSCPHSTSFTPCAFDSSRECVYLRAGADLAAGQEVCFYYGYLLPDRALLEYGFLPQQPLQQMQMEDDTAAAAAQWPSVPVEDEVLLHEADAVEAAAAAGGIAEETLQLFGIDRHDVDLDAAPLVKLDGPPEPFTGEEA